MDKIGMMRATLEEDEDKRKAHALHVQVVGWAQKESPQEDAKNLRAKIRASNIPFASAWSVGSLDHTFHGYEKEKSFPSKRIE